MYAVVTYANMRGVRAVDRIVDLCQRDLAFIWLTKGEKPKRDVFVRIQKNLLKIAAGEGIPFVDGKGERKPEIQKLYEELGTCGRRLMEYKQCFEINEGDFAPQKRVAPEKKSDPTGIRASTKPESCGIVSFLSVRSQKTVFSDSSISFREIFITDAGKA